MLDGHIAMGIFFTATITDVILYRGDKDCITMAEHVMVHVCVCCVCAYTRTIDYRVSVCT